MWPDFSFIFNFQPYLTIAGLAGICSCLEIVVSALRLACSVCKSMANLVPRHAFSSWKSLDYLIEISSLFTKKNTVVGTSLSLRSGLLVTKQQALKSRLHYSISRLRLLITYLRSNAHQVVTIKPRQTPTCRRRIFLSL